MQPDSQCTDNLIGKYLRIYNSKNLQLSLKVSIS